MDTGYLIAIVVLDYTISIVVVPPYLRRVWLYIRAVCIAVQLCCMY